LLRKNKAIAGLALLGALFPIIYAAAFPVKGEATGTSYPSLDSYATIAAQLADTGVLGDNGVATAQREPLYPMLLALAFKTLGKSYAAEVALNVPLNALLILLLYKTGQALFSEAVGLVAAGIAAFYPPLIYYAAQPRRETLLAVLSVASVLLLVSAWRRGKIPLFAAAGAVNSLAALANTTFLPFGLVAAPAWLLWLGRKKLGKTAVWAAVYVAAFSAVYAPWPLRNYAVFHRLIAGTAGAGGTVFYVNQLVPPEVGGLPQEMEIVHNDPVYKASAGITDPVALDRYFWKAGFDRVKADPARFLSIALRRFFVDEWRLAPRPRAYEHSSAAVRLVSLLSDGWIIPLGLFGLLCLWKARPPESVWVLWLILTYNAVYAAIFSIMRYRLPVMPWVILFAALTLTRAAKPTRSRS
jgi:4-amino-4-deoxy-L-arabinose transferase-like glycosyltransferase